MSGIDGARTAAEADKATRLSDVRSMEVLTESALRNDGRAAPKHLDRNSAGTARCRACSERAVAPVRELGCARHRCTDRPCAHHEMTPRNARHAASYTARPARRQCTEPAMTLDVLLIAARADG